MAFSSLGEVINEIWQNRMRMLRVVWFDIKIENRSLYLGTLWKIISPLILLGIFWFVFGIGIRGGAPVDDFPFILWLLSGLVPWFFVRSGIIGGAMSISSKAAMIFKIKYPVVTVPVGAIIINLYDHLIMLVILVVIFVFNGIFPNLYWLNLVYYSIFIFVFLSSFALVTSVVVQLARDFGRLITSLMQLLFFLTPILWQESNIPQWARPFFIINPVRYVVSGYRYALLYQANFWERPLLIVSFWSMTIVILLLGCWLQKKYSTRFVDWM